MPLSRASSHLPSTDSRAIAAMVGRISNYLLHFPCLREALGMSQHPSTCLGWQWAITVLAAFLQPGQQKDGISISHHGISRVLWGGGPSGTLSFTFGMGYAHGAVQSHHSPGGTTPVCFPHCHCNLCWLVQIKSDSPKVSWLALGQNRDSKGATAHLLGQDL